VFIVFLLSFVALLTIGVPVAIVLGGAAFIYMIRDGFYTLLVQSTYAGIASFPLLAIPLFMLAGNLMGESGITEELSRFARLLLGHIRGGLGLATIFAAGIFAAITGSAVATVVAVGGVLIPAMLKAGYDDDVSASVAATASCLGPIIPPSIPFIIYGVIANVSITALFLAGIIPGILLALSLMVYMYMVARKRGYPIEARASVGQVVSGAWKALPALMMPVIILGGILGGIFTPTESAGIAVVYALIVDVLIYKKLKLGLLRDILFKSGLESAMVMILLGLSEPFAWVVAVEQIPQLLLDLLNQAHLAPIVVMLIINAGLLLIGIPLETAPALTIVVPVLAPMALKLGIDPVQFGVIVCFNLVLGLITPPVGGVLFSVCSITGISLERLGKAIWAPFGIAIIVLLLITVFPPLTTFLPSLFIH
jgi:C4-dicarboxylate transporter DctM subunit